MKTNRIMDDIRSTISPEMKLGLCPSDGKDRDRSEPMALRYPQLDNGHYLQNICCS